jgi:enoyl-CoA hydratase/carnithine racemase
MRDLGVCRQVLANTEVLPAALELARDVAANAAPLSVAVSKELFWDTWVRSRPEIEQLETALHQHLMAHPDAREGVVAFLEHRPAKWQGSPSTQFPTWPEV